MWYEVPSVVTPGVTWTTGLVVPVILTDPLSGILIAYSVSKARAWFWAVFAPVMVVLVPFGVVASLARVPDSPRTSDPNQTIVLFKWGVIGLTGTVTVLIGVFGRCHGATMVIDPDRFDALNRLRVCELRAQELLDPLDREDIHATR